MLVVSRNPEARSALGSRYPGYPKDTALVFRIAGTTLGTSQVEFSGYRGVLSTLGNRWS